VLDSKDSGDWEYRDRLYRDLCDGVIAGLLGAGSIMILFLVSDALLFRPLATPDFLAQTFLGQESHAADIAGRLRIIRIVMFTVLHLAAFMFLGIVLAEVLRITGFRSTLLRGGLYGATVCSIVFGVSLHLSGTEVSARPGWAAVLLGNFVAGVVMGGYLQLSAQRDSPHRGR
jgi:hypothetical protein